MIACSSDYYVGKTAKYGKPILWIHKFRINHIIEYYDINYWINLTQIYLKKHKDLASENPVTAQSMNFRQTSGNIISVTWNLLISFL